MIIDPATINWKRPDYDAICQRRLEVLEQLNADPKMLAAFKAHYRERPWDFMGDWGVTFDPRNQERGLPGIIPFVLFEKQISWVQWVMAHWRAQKSGLTEKSRDAGVSYLAIGLSCTLCLFEDGIAVGFGSRKEEYVDKLDEPKSLFWKARLFMEHVPPCFRGDWVAWRDAPHMRIKFPQTGSIISGEAGDQIGRGDRRSLEFVDEAQPLDAKIMTPWGWKLMADIRVGSVISGPDGGRRSVIVINDCGVHDVYRITFSDGTAVECSENHLWKVRLVLGVDKSAVMRTSEMVKNFKHEDPRTGNIKYRYRIPACAPVRFARRRKGRLPIHPYLAGVMLGDGGLRSGVVRLTTADAEIVQSFRDLLPVGVVIGRHDGRYSYNIVDAEGRRGRGPGGSYLKSRARTAMVAAGLYGVSGPDKSIPDRYKFAARRDRLALLQGLMDTDGHASKANGSASFYTSSPALAVDVRFLVQSLGGTATCSVKPDHRGHRDIYALQIALPGRAKPFRLTRKLRLWKRRRHPLGRTIVGIDYVGRRPVRCITVDAPDGLYLTDNFAVTHNSAHLERPKLVDFSLSQTTNCRVDVSSVNGMNNPFAQKRHGTRPADEMGAAEWESWREALDDGPVEYPPNPPFVFVFDWRDDPRKDDDWYRKQQTELDPVVVAQEIDRDYQASVTGVVIPGPWVRAAIGALEKLGLEPTGAKGISLDVADEGVDKNALCFSHGVSIEATAEWSGKGADIFDTVQRTFRACDTYGVDEFDYDSDGLGAGVRGDARAINDQRKARRQHVVAARGWRGSEAVVDPDGIVEGTKGREGDKGRTNKDYFANRKSQGWWSLRARFQKTYRWVVEQIPCNPDDIININPACPNHQALVTELSQPTYKTNGVGKILIDKSPDGMKSPNKADSVMIRFAPKEPKPVVFTGEMVRQIAMAGARSRLGERQAALLRKSRGY